MNDPNSKQKKHDFDLEDRTLEFAKRITRLCKALPKNLINNPLINQIVRSGCSIGANYREANDALSKKDFLHRIRITRKETKETRYWLKIIVEANPDFSVKMVDLLQESLELKKIFSAIIDKSDKKVKQV
jgi:four helix bundle protein